MSGPADAQLNGDGFRFYEWTDADTGEVTNVLSVTSIRSLVGEPFHLVRWKQGNLLDVGLGQRKVTKIGPRGGVSEKRVRDVFPSEFHTKYMDTNGEEAKLEELRKWMQTAADQPRNVPARRGTMTHEAIEKNVAWRRIERPYVESAFDRLSKRDKDAAFGGVLDEDVNFVRNGVRQYWAFRKAHPNIVIVAQELQCFNLTAGYAGSFDALGWETPADWVGPLPKPDDITADFMRQHGGTLILIDWKTSPEVYTDHVVQAHAYMGSEFVGKHGVKDQRMTELMNACREGAVVSIRPNKYGLFRFRFQEEVMYAFLGACVFARFLARHPKPDALFYDVEYGSSDETEDDDGPGA